MRNFELSSNEIFEKIFSFSIENLKIVFLIFSLGEPAIDGILGPKSTNFQT